MVNTIEDPTLTSPLTIDGKPIQPIPGEYGPQKGKVIAWKPENNEGPYWVDSLHAQALEKYQAWLARASEGEVVPTDLNTLLLYR